MVPRQDWLFYNVRFLKPCLPSVWTIVVVSEKGTLKHQHYPGKILLQGRTLQDPVLWGQGKGQIILMPLHVNTVDGDHNELH